MGVPKKTLVRKDIPKQKISNLVRFETKILQRFWF